MSIADTLHGSYVSLRHSTSLSFSLSLSLRPSLDISQLLNLQPRTLMRPLRALPDANEQVRSVRVYMCLCVCVSALCTHQSKNSSPSIAVLRMATMYLCVDLFTAMVFLTSTLPRLMFCTQRQGTPSSSPMHIERTVLAVCPHTRMLIFITQRPQPCALLESGQQRMHVCTKAHQ